MHVNKISMELQIMNFNGTQVEFFLIISVMKICFCLCKQCNNLNEMLHYAAFHHGLHCLPKHLFTGIHAE